MMAATRRFRLSRETGMLSPFDYRLLSAISPFRRLYHGFPGVAGLIDDTYHASIRLAASAMRRESALKRHAAAARRDSGTIAAF